MWSSPVPSMSFRLPATGSILALTRPFRAMSALFLPREGNCYSGGTPPDKSTMAGILPEALRIQMEADLCAVLLCRACSHIPDRCSVLQQIADAKTSSRARGGDVWVSECRPLRRTKYTIPRLASERASERVYVPWCIPGAGADPRKVQCSWRVPRISRQRAGQWAASCPTLPYPVAFRYPYIGHAVGIT
ncbi:hypothetical protein LY76DRAFT_184968 [Colletotrichum caudatum]|nr:hypothetical protein LY76DRAFT_184968 [Colletotrichum caudatum]